MSTRLASLASAIILVAVLAAPVAAQRGPGAGGQMFGNPAPARNQAGDFDYYALVLSWSPTHCATVERGDNDPQCHRRDGRRYAFVLHGLWPQHEKGYPEFCPTRARPYVPNNIIDSMLDIMPSPKLVIHEYRKHGTCSGLTPAEYYATSRKLFSQIRIPQQYVNTQEGLMVEPGELMQDFLKANPSIKPDMIAVSCGGPGNRLREIRVCFDRAGQFRACGRNEDQRRLCSAQKMYLPPVRSTGQGPIPPVQAGERASPLPAPRVIPMLPGR
jgi:ribonuclease T2